MWAVASWWVGLRLPGDRKENEEMRRSGKAIPVQQHSLILPVSANVEVRGRQQASTSFGQVWKLFWSGSEPAGSLERECSSITKTMLPRPIRGSLGPVPQWATAIQRESRYFHFIFLHLKIICQSSFIQTGWCINMFYFEHLPGCNNIYICWLHRRINRKE